MNLVVDIGNSRIKYAVFEREQLLWSGQSGPEGFLAQVKHVFKTYPLVTHAILASVGKPCPKEYDVLALFCSVHKLTPSSKTPFKNSYATPQTLGVDRIALATAAFFYAPRGNTLVLDAGTCLTYDMVNDYGEYLGGAISPGLLMRYRALHEQTAGLPLLDPELPLDLIGNATAQSMHSGVVNGICAEIEGVVEQYRARYADLTVILTGGDARFLSKRLKNTIFAHSNFLLEGLNYLLEYNKTK